MKQPELGNKVLELRQNLGLTQAELAEKSNVSLRTIQRVEALEVTPRNYTIKAILSCLGYDLKNELPGDVPAGENSKNGHVTRIARFFRYVRELFNLKTNTMKKLSVLTVFAVLMFAGIFFANTSLIAQNRKMKAVTESLVGVWQQVVADPETGDVTYYLPILKIFSPDGTYVHMSELAGDSFSFINASGKWKVTSENTFTEYVELMYEATFTNRQEKQTFHIDKRPDGTFMRSKYSTKGTEMGEIHETWRKCGLIPRKKANEMRNKLFGDTIQ